MITAYDLALMIQVIDERGMAKYPGDTHEYKDELLELRLKISEELDNIEINTIKRREVKRKNE